MSTFGLALTRAIRREVFAAARRCAHEERSHREAAMDDHMTGVAPQEPDVLTVDEVAALLRVDRKSIYAAVARGEVPGVLRLGRLIRFSREVVLRWIREGQTSSRTRRNR